MTSSPIPHKVRSLLGGDNVLICRPEESAQHLATALSALGAKCHTFPTLKLLELPISDLEKQYILSLDQYQYVIVTSQHAAKIGLELIDSYWPQFPIEQTWLAIGLKTSSLLCTENIKLILPEKDLTSEALLKLPQLHKVKGQKILILKGKEGRQTLTQVLSKRGARLDSIELYERVRPSYTKKEISAALIKFKANYIVALSGETLLNLISLCEENNIDLSSKTFIVPSHRVANIAYEHSFKSVIIPANLKPIDLIKSITNHKKIIN
ncbi:MAG: uroporphyrinogen-III synthase [Oleiphilaceae bacterium]|jgi:uroporphyrinogen-III synthase